MLMSAFGPKAVALAARISDGYYGAWPSKGLLTRYRQLGGRGPAVGELKVCFAESEDNAVETALRHWRHELVPGQASQELPTTTAFDWIAKVATPEMARERWVCGPDPQRHVDAIQAYLDAGYDEVHVLQMGPDQQGMIDFYAERVLPRFS